jgi:hypothetical protein
VSQLDMYVILIAVMSALALLWLFVFAMNK